MLMINAIIYIFLSYAMFDQQLKITFRKSPFLLPPLKIPKSASPPFLPTLKIFQAPCRKGVRTL